MFNIMIVQETQETCCWMAELLSAALPDIYTISCQSIAEAKTQFGKQSIGLALVDFTLPDGSGLTLIPYMRDHSPGIRIIVMTLFDDPEHIFPAIRMGAMGYLLKDQPKEVLIAKLRGAMNGDPPLSPAIARKILEQVRQSAPPSGSGNEPMHIRLSKRDEEILVLMSKGMNRTDIASILSLSPHTVARYIKDVYKKLDVSSRAEAAIIACRIGLVRM